MTPWMKTYSGARFFPSKPRANDVNPQDICHALSLTCRYGGHCRFHYPVAQHSVLLARYTRDVLKRPDGDVFFALMHDAHEAYSWDILSPIKRSVPGMKDFEHAIEAEVRTALGLPIETPEWLDYIDKAIYWDEDAALLPCPENTRQFGGVADKGLGIKIEEWPWRWARLSFTIIYNLYKSEDLPHVPIFDR